MQNYETLSKIFPGRTQSGIDTLCTCACTTLVSMCMMDGRELAEKNPQKSLVPSKKVVSFGQRRREGLPFLVEAIRKVLLNAVGLVLQIFFPQRILHNS